MSKVKYEKYITSVESLRKKEYIRFIFNDIEVVKNIKIFHGLSELLINKYTECISRLNKQIDSFFKRIFAIHFVPITVTSVAYVFTYIY